MRKLMRAGTESRHGMQFEDVHLLRRFAENLPGAAFLYSEDGMGRQRIDFLNEGCAIIWGFTKRQIGNDPSLLWAAVDQDDLELVAASVQKSARDLTIWECRFRITDASGKRKHLLAKGTPERLPDGSTTWLTFLFDISARIETEARVETVTKQLHLVNEAIPDGFAMFDAKERMVICNGRFQTFYALGESRSYEGMTYVEVLRHALKHHRFPEAQGREREWIEQRRRAYLDGTSTVEERIGDMRWLRVLDRPTADGGRICLRIETTPTRVKQLELEHAAATDASTGLLNRRGLADRFNTLEDWLAPRERLAVFHLDLDKFKTINDAFGHDAGDFVIATVAARLSALGDRRTQIARFGGDEFVIAQPMIDVESDLVPLAEEFRAEITRPILFEGRLCQVGASVGVSVWDPQGSETIQQCILDADTALLAGKKLGRNRTVVFANEMRRKAVETANLAGEIKEGLAKNRFVPFFQPQFEMPEGRVCGIEALARWRRADGSFQPAAAFVEVANDTGLIGMIDRAMMHGSFDLLSELGSVGMHGLRVSLNFSSVQLRDPAIVESILDKTMIRGIGADQVAIEILESTLLDDCSDIISSNIRALAKAGFRIELDDFGTGHTALASLRRFPVHRIKIDRSLIRDINSEAASRAITEGIFALCRELGIETMAEGVETAAELDTLCSMGFRLFQGYHFARPMAKDALLEWLGVRAPSRTAS